MDGKTLKKLMRTTGLTQKEIAKRVGYSSQSLTHWVSGTHPVPEWFIFAVVGMGAKPEGIITGLKIPDKANFIAAGVLTLAKMK